MTVDLASPLALPCGLTLSNRLAKAAMTEALGDPRRRPSPELLRLYRGWAESGAGLLITGNVGVDRDHPVRPRDVMLDPAADLEPFQRWAEVARAGGARVIMQLNHGGRQTPRFVNPRPLGPSDGGAVEVMRGAFGPARGATLDDLRELVRRFVWAAQRAQAAGFDGVQIHAAHGYLLSQFLSPDINRRRDRYGGDVRGRARLLLEIVGAVRASTSRSFAVTVKLNSADFLRGGFSHDDALAVVTMLDGQGIDLLEISGGRYESGASFGYASDAGAREAYFLGFAEQARAVFRAPLMLTGGLRSRAAMEAALDRATDLVGIARPMALVPDYPRRLLAGEPVPAIRSRRTGVGRLEGAAELAWYSMQLARMGRGRAVRRSLSGWRALAWYVLGDVREAARSRRQRRRARLEHRRGRGLLPRCRRLST